MEANFVDIATPLKKANLQLPTLNVLTPDSRFYEVMAIQPEGKIEAHKTFIGHTDHATAVAKFSAFLNLAIEKDCDLALSPEYSCPWDVLGSAISNNSLPKMGKIWSLGCESITPDQLDAFIATHSNVVWIREPLSTITGQFFDVLAYITKTKNITGEEIGVIVLQFKTQPMGGDTFERDHLIRGQSIYIWHNPEDIIRLISLICSDALVFDDSDMKKCGLSLHPCIIFHLQLTQDPHHVDYRRYRSRLFAKNLGERYEVLTLNWARGFKLPDCQPNPYGGSAIYTKSPQFMTCDSRLDSNHQKGMFYTFWHAHRTELCFFSFDQHVFYYRTPKTMQDVEAVLAQRTGPEMLSLFGWDAVSGSWKHSVKSDDGFDKLCTSFPPSGCDFLTNTPHTAIDRERLFTLSAGKLRPLLDWHTIRKIDSFLAAEDERSKRITFPQQQRDFSKNFAFMRRLYGANSKYNQHCSRYWGRP